jgi:predicted DNA primase small subunit
MKQNGNTSERTVLAKEFVIDIDINDYPERKCCQKQPKVCNRCWAYLALAIQIIDRTLRNDHGFRRLLWVYSGRRGVHLWVSDRTAMLLDDKERQSIMKGLNGFRLLNGKEVSTWRPEKLAEDERGGGSISKEKKLADRMRRQVHPAFRYEGNKVSNDSCTNKS